VTELQRSREREAVDFEADNSEKGANRGQESGDKRPQVVESDCSRHICRRSRGRFDQHTIDPQTTVETTGRPWAGPGSG
jgi:hypothetical protein